MRRRVRRRKRRCNAQSCRRIAALQSPTREHEGERAAIRAKERRSGGYVDRRWQAICSSAATRAGHADWTTESHGYEQSGRRCCLATDAGAGWAPMARRRTLAAPPIRASGGRLLGRSLVARCESGHAQLLGLGASGQLPADLRRGPAPAMPARRPTRCGSGWTAPRLTSDPVPECVPELQFVGLQEARGARCFKRMVAGIEPAWTRRACARGTLGAPRRRTQETPPPGSPAP